MLHPLLTHTQLRSVPYKRQQILRTLESLVAHAEIREINATTKRLVERCLGASWALQIKKERDETKASASSQSGSVSSMSTGTAYSQDHVQTTFSQLLQPISTLHPLKDERYMKFSKSVDVLTLKPAKDPAGKPSGSHHEDDMFKKAKTKPKSAVLELRRASNESSLSLLSVAGAAPAPPRRQHPPVSPTSSLPSSSVKNNRLPTNSDASRYPDMKRHSADPPLALLSSSSWKNGRAASTRVGDRRETAPPATPIFDDPVEPHVLLNDVPEQDLDPPPSSPAPSPTTRASSPPRYRPAPAPPAKRRKPPAVPSRSTKALVRDGPTMTTIASSKPAVAISVPSPLSRVSG